MHIGFAENRNRNNNNRSYNNSNDSNNNYNSNNDSNNSKGDNNDDNNDNDITHAKNRNNKNDYNKNTINSYASHENHNNNDKNDNDGMNNENALVNQSIEQGSGMILEQRNSYELSHYYEDLLSRFESVQDKHVKFRLSTIQQVKLRTSTADVTPKAGSGSGSGLLGDMGGEQAPAGSGVTSGILFTEDL